MRKHPGQLLSIQAPALVTEGNERAALAVTRGLGQAGIPVMVAAETERSLRNPPEKEGMSSGELSGTLATQARRFPCASRSSMNRTLSPF